MYIYCRIYKINVHYILNNYKLFNVFFSQLKIPSKAAFKLRPRDVIVNLKKKHIFVGIKGQPPILDDELQHEIKLEETTWLLEDGKTFLINIEKVNKF